MDLEKSLSSQRELRLFDSWPRNFPPDEENIYIQVCKKLAWITASDLGVRHISETLSQTKCILFMEEEQEGKKIRWSGFNIWQDVL